MKSYDAIIIGSGQGGNPLAHKLADDGRKVALIEREHLGGTCVNEGCTPTKTMMASARIAHYARRAAEFGVHTGPVHIDLAEVVARKNAIVQEWRQGQERKVAERPTLDLYRGHGRLNGRNRVEVSGEQLQAETIILNTGTRPRIPELPGLETIDYLTNRSIMELTEIPDHLIVMGGNAIGLEFGQMFLRFGSRVTVLEINKEIVSREDEDIALCLREILQAQGMEFRLGVHATHAQPVGNGIELTISGNDGEERLIGSHLLLAIGRVPNSDDLGLEAAGIETDRAGYIRVNEYLETNVPGIYALGDVKGGPAFTHIAYDDHFIIYERLTGGAPRTTKDRLVPYALYTDPELGRVGMTEKEARDKGYNLKVGTIPVSHVARAVERGETAGMMKIIINAENDRILGASILAPEGGELVQTLMTLIMADAPWALFRRAMFIHPTMTEGFFTLMESVR